MGTSTDSRGASSVLATLLLTGIVAITVTASGAAYIDHSLDGTAAGHTVGQVDVSANDTTVDVVHLGGDGFDPETLEAVLKSDDDSVRVPFTDGTISGGGDFDPASTWRYDYGDALDGHLKKVYVVYAPKNDVLDVERFTNTTVPVTDDGGNVESGDGGDTGGVTAGALVDLAVNVSDRSEHSSGNAGKSIYWVTWNATTNASNVDHVTVELTGLGSKNTGASKSYQDEQTAHTASGGLCFADGDNTHQHGNTYAINVTAYNADGTAVGYWNTTDVVDGDDPATSEVVDVDASPSNKCDVGDDSDRDWSGFFDEFAVIDQSGPVNGNHAAYTVTYALSDEYDGQVKNITMDFLDRGEASGSPTWSATKNGEPETVVRAYSGSDVRRNASSDGATEIVYRDQSSVGNEHELVFRIYGADGSVLGERTISDVADGFDPDGNGVSLRDGQPLSNVTLVDFSGPDKGASYYVDYTANDSVATVSASFVDTDEGDRASYDTPTQSVPEDGTGRLAGDNPKGGTLGDGFNITVRAFDADGDLVDQYVLTDVADGRDTHDGRTVDTRHYITKVGLDDKSNEHADKTHYQVDYELMDSMLDSVVVFHNENTNETTKMDGGSNTKVNFVSDKGTYGDYYNVTVLAVNDGVVVDRHTLRDRSGEAPWGDGEQSSTDGESPKNVGNLEFAYIDTNGDWQYDKHVDEKVNNPKHGVKTTKGTLVIPPDVNADVWGGKTLSADGIYIGGSVTHSSKVGDLTLDANDGALWLDGGSVTGEKSGGVSLRGARLDASDASVSARGPITVDATGDISLTGSDVAITKDGDPLSVSSESGSISLADTAVSTGGSVEVTAATGIDLTSGTVSVKKASADVSLEGGAGDVDLTDATLSATRKGQSGSHQNDLTATVDSGYSVIVDGATFEDDDDKLDVEPDGASTDTSKTT